MKFNYKKYGPNIFRPVIDIKVFSKSDNIRYYVLVDSGADICLFHTEVAEALGIDVKKGSLQTVTGIGGKTSAYYLHKVKIEVGGFDYEIDVGFMENIGNRSIAYGVVGQKGFFENFVVKFDFSKKEVELKIK